MVDLSYATFQGTKTPTSTGNLSYDAFLKSKQPSPVFDGLKTTSTAPIDFSKVSITPPNVFSTKPAPVDVTQPFNTPVPKIDTTVPVSLYDQAKPQTLPQKMWSDITSIWSAPTPKQESLTPESYLKNIYGENGTLLKTGYLADIKNSWDTAVSSFQNLPPQTASETDKVAGLTRAGLDTINAFFTPVTSFFQRSATVQGPIGDVSNFVNNIFASIGVVGSDPLVQMVQQSDLFTQEQKDKLAPLAGELGALAAQIVVGKVGSDVLGKMKEKTNVFLQTIAEDSRLKELNANPEMQRHISDTLKATAPKDLSPAAFEAAGSPKPTETTKIPVTPETPIASAPSIETKQVETIKAVETPAPETSSVPLNAEKTAKLNDVETSVPQPTGVAPKPIEAKAPTQFESMVFARMKAEHPQLEGSVGYDPIKLKEDIAKATDLVANDKQKAFRIAMGHETSSNVTSTAVNIAMTEKALAEGNHTLASRLIRNRSLEQTRRGQELVAERGSVTDNSTSKYVKELVAARLEILGKRYLSDLTNKVLKTTDKGKAMKALENEVAKVEKQIKTKKLNIKDALSLLDKITCA